MPFNLKNKCKNGHHWLRQSNGKVIVASNERFAQLVAEFEKHPYAVACQTVDGAFANCKPVSASFASLCRRKGFEARVLQLPLAIFNFPNAHPSWKKMQSQGKQAASHYVVEVQGHGIYDWSYRQFDPDGPHPRIWPNDDSHLVALDWDEPKHFGLTLSRWPNRFRYRKAVSVFQDAPDTYLHGTGQKFNEFKLNALGWGHGVIYFSKKEDFSVLGKSQAEYYVKQGGQLIEAKLDQSRLKRFNPYRDPEAAAVMDKLKEAGKIDDSRHDYSSGLKWSDFVEYPDMPPIVEEANKSGYNYFRVREPSVQNFSWAVTDPSLIRIVKTTHAQTNPVVDPDWMQNEILDAPVGDSSYQNGSWLLKTEGWGEECFEGEGLEGEAAAAEAESLSEQVVQNWMSGEGLPRGRWMFVKSGYARHTSCLHGTTWALFEKYRSSKTVTAMRGEWWIIDSQAIYADDMTNHILEAIQHLIAEHDDTLMDAMDEKDIDYMDGDITWDAVRLLSLEDLIKAGLTPEEAGMLLESPGSTDPRDYAMRKWGWIRVRGSNVQTYGLTPESLRSMESGLWDADEDAENQSFFIEDLQSKQVYYDVPFSVISTKNPTELYQYGARTGFRDANASKLVTKQAGTRSWSGAGGTVVASLNVDDEEKVVAIQEWDSRQSGGSTIALQELRSQWPGYSIRVIRAIPEAVQFWLKMADRGLVDFVSNDGNVALFCSAVVKERLRKQSKADTDTKPVWLGQVDANGGVLAYRTEDPVNIVHENFFTGRGFNAFRYVEKEMKVYWWEDPDQENLIAVENFFYKKGKPVLGHFLITDLYEVLNKSHHGGQDEDSSKPIDKARTRKKPLNEPAESVVQACFNLSKFKTL